MEDHLHRFDQGDVSCLFNPYSLEKIYVDRKNTIDCLDQEALRSSRSELHPPQPSISCFQLVVTTDCNLSCGYCQVYKNPPLTSATRMSRTEAERLARQFNRNLRNKGLMIITGGEPLTNWPVVDYLVSQVEGTKVLFTNATLMTPEIASKLLDGKVNVVVSIDGPACLNDSVRTGPGGWPTYHAISGGIRAMRDVGLKFGISMVCAKHNLSFLSESAEFLIEEFSPVSIGINLPHYVEYAQSLVDVDPIEYAKQLCMIFEISKEYGIYVDQIARRLRPLVTEQFLFRDCLAYGGKQVHFPGGVASNCINMVQESPADFSIWQDRMPLNIEDCQGCYAIGICGGGCFFDALHRVGDGYKIDPRHCDVIKTLLEYFIWDIWKTCQVSRPSKSEMFSAYEWILSRNGKLNISIGHDESDAQKRSRFTVV